MQRNAGTYYFIIAMLLLAVTCRKPYEPAVLIKGDNYLVVDGFINTSPNGITTIVLSRTKNLADTVVNIPERGATVQVQNAAGAGYYLHEQGSNGNYVSSALQLSNTNQYTLNITTSSGKHYSSDLVTARQSPAIDSVNWVQDSLGVHVYVNTHDPSNNTRYYRWQYVETWEYHAQFQTPWALNGNTVYVRDFSDLVWLCYRTTSSGRVLLGSSAALSQDVISLGKLVVFSPNDTMLANRMSIEVKQYALTPQAYGYWQIIQKNSEQLGTLFDLQPSQLEGNIHCTSNPGEPVVGFITACTETTKRIFISVFDLRDWTVPPGGYNCVTKIIDQDPNNFANWTYPDPEYGPYYFSGSSIVIAKKVCLDCRLSGGTTVKPAFW